jgi:hypothetical protein
MKWYPGWMSAPHHYRTDRLCVVISDGVKADAAEPVVIAVTGMGPVNQRWVDPSQPILRRI